MLWSCNLAYFQNPPSKARRLRRQRKKKHKQRTCLHLKRGNSKRPPNTGKRDRKSWYGFQLYTSFYFLFNKSKVGLTALSLSSPRQDFMEESQAIRTQHLQRPAPVSSTLSQKSKTHMGGSSFGQHSKSEGKLTVRKQRKIVRMILESPLLPSPHPGLADTGTREYFLHFPMRNILNVASSAAI